MSRPAQPSAWNAANALTGARLLLVPVFWVLLLHDGGTHPRWRVAAFFVFAVASLSDRYDGELARRRGQVTDLGKIADPIADKALVGAALVALSLLGQVAWWVTVVILAREVAVTVVRFAVIRHGVIAASRGGKAKTLLQAVALGLYVLPAFGPSHALADVIMIVAVVVTLATGGDYLRRAVRLRQVGQRAATHMPAATSAQARCASSENEHRDRPW